MTQSEIFKAAHGLARQMEFKSYRRCLSEGLKIVYANIRLVNTAKKFLTEKEKSLITESNGRLLVDNTGFKNQEMIDRLSKYSYNNWKTYTNHQLCFSSQIINSLR